MFCAACIVVNVNVALHLDLCEKKLSGMEMEKWRLVVLPPSVGDLINHLLCTATCGSKYTEARFSSFFHCCEMKCSSNIHRLTVFSTRQR